MSFNDLKFDCSATSTAQGIGRSLSVMNTKGWVDLFLSSDDEHSANITRGGEAALSASKEEGAMTIKHANLPGHPNMPLNIWGKATLLLGLLYRQGLLPKCDIYGVGEEGAGGYEINGIRVGSTEEQVTTCIWLMAESYAAEGHISFQDNQTVAEAALEAAAA